MKNRFIFASLTALIGLAGNVMAQSERISINSNFAGGNIQVDSIRGNTVFLRPELRDTGQDWFYWYFNMIPSENGSVHFQFTRPNCITVKGPAVSIDGGQSWKWLPESLLSGDSFSYYGNAGQEVRFSMGMPYTGENFNKFISSFRNHPAVHLESLCTTPKGRQVEKLIISPPANKTPRQKVLISARHHSCEMMANYVLEGIIRTILSADKQMVALRNTVEFWIIPFVDKDGVEDGDQGKSRIPRDHNRDYDGESIYCATRALRNTVPEWSKGKLSVALDLHCPWIKGSLNEHIYLVGIAREEIARQQEVFTKIVAENNRGELKFDLEKGLLPFGTAWNTSRNYTQGMPFDDWASTLEGIKLSGSFEIPYSLHNNQTLSPENLRDFGKDMAFSIADYLGRVQ